LNIRVVFVKIKIDGLNGLGNRNPHVRKGVSKSQPQRNRVAGKREKRESIRQCGAYLQFNAATKHTMQQHIGESVG
jgi:hypothetical protein